MNTYEGIQVRKEWANQLTASRAFGISPLTCDHQPKLEVAA